MATLGTDWYDFNGIAVRLMAPSRCGVYGLARGPQWVYIGKADDIQGRLLEHLSDKSHAMHASGPLKFSYEECDSPDERERFLIVQCRPTCNQRIG